MRKILVAGSLIMAALTAALVADAGPIIVHPTSVAAGALAASGTAG